MLRKTLPLLGILVAIAVGAVQASEYKYAPWVVYYSDKAEPQVFNRYNLIVFDSEYHPRLQPLLNEDKMLLGYLSLGEAEKDRTYFYDIKKKGILLGENKKWPGSYAVDIRNHQWSEMVLESIIPDILNKGFKGIFLDTLDSPLDLERRDPKRYRGMKMAALNLIKAIRHHYPSITIMMNRAYEILPEAAPYVDMQLGESTLTDYNFGKKTYEMVNAPLYQKQVKMLQLAKRINPKLKVYTLDYWNPEDKEQIKNIYNTQEQNGFYPYVSTVMLDRVVEKPR